MERKTKVLLQFLEQFDANPFIVKFECVVSVGVIEHVKRENDPLFLECVVLCPEGG